MKTQNETLLEVLRNLKERNANIEGNRVIKPYMQKLEIPQWKE